MCERFEEALDCLSSFLSIVDDPPPEYLRLQALLYTKVNPSKFTEAHAIFDTLVHRHPEDLSLVILS
jgi:hypothetical protein